MIKSEIERKENQLERVVNRILNTRVSYGNEPKHYIWDGGDAREIESRDTTEKITPAELKALEARRDELRAEIERLKRSYDIASDQANREARAQIDKQQSDRKTREEAERKRIQEVDRRNEAITQAKAWWNSKSKLYWFFHKAPTAKRLDSMTTDQIENLYRKR